MPRAQGFVEPKPSLANSVGGLLTRVSLVAPHDRSAERDRLQFSDMVLIIGYEAWLGKPSCDRRFVAPFCHSVAGGFVIANSCRRIWNDLQGAPQVY